MERVDFQRGTIVSLIWQDSAFLSGWQKKEALKGEVCHIDTIGYVVGNNEACITVSTSIDKDTDAAMCPLSIPWAAVVTIEEVNP